MAKSKGGTMSAEARATMMLRKWVKEQIKEVDEIDVDVLTDEALEKYASDQSFVQSLIKERFRSWIADAVREVLSETRANIPMGPGVYVSRKKFDEKVASSRFSKWMERTEKGHYVKLVAMDRTTALQAVALRKGLAEEHERVARFIEALAKPLKDGEKIGDRYTDNDLFNVWQSVNGEVTPPEEIAS